MKNTLNELPVYKQAESSRQDNNHSEAIRLYTEGIKQCTYHLEDCFLGRCKSYIEIGEFENAINDCSKIVKTNPNNADAWLYYGIASFHLKNYSDSLKHLKHSKELSQDPTFALDWIALVNSSIGEYQNASQNIKKVLQRNSTDQFASKFLQKISTKMAHENEEAVVLNMDTGDYVSLESLPFGRYKVYEGRDPITTVYWDGSSYAKSELKSVIGKKNWGLKPL